MLKSIRRSRIVAIAIVLKTITSQGVRGFESHLLRHRARTEAKASVLALFLPFLIRSRDDPWK